MNKRERIKRGFDLLSPFYDPLSFIFFGRSLWRSQAYFLPRLERSKNVLIIGGGTGRILEELLRLDTASKYYYLDLSKKMIKRAEERIKKRFPDKTACLTFHEGDISKLPADNSFDVVITPYVLDCVAEDELLAEMREIDARLERGGKWLFTDFQYSERPLTETISKALVKILYLFFRICCSVTNKSLPAFEEAFTLLGYQKADEKYFLGGMTVTRIYLKS